MESVFKSVLEEELERNLRKQAVFSNELSKYPKGSLVVLKVHGDKYLYRKYRLGAKIISNYVGPVDSDESRNAYREREQFLLLKQDIKDLKDEENKLRRMIRIYA